MATVIWTHSPYTVVVNINWSVVLDRVSTSYPEMFEVVLKSFVLGKTRGLFFQSLFSRGYFVNSSWIFPLASVSAMINIVAPLGLWRLVEVSRKILYLERESFHQCESNGQNSCFWPYSIKLWWEFLICRMKHNVTSCWHILQWMMCPVLSSLFCWLAIEVCFWQVEITSPNLSKSYPSQSSACFNHTIPQYSGITLNHQ